MRDQINKLKDERAGLVEQMRAVTITAESENRDLTSEEAQEFDRLEKEVDELGTRATRMEALAGYPSQLQRQVPPGDDNGGEPDKAPETLREFNEQRSRGLVQDDPEYRNAFFRMMTARDMNELDSNERRALSKATAGAGLNIVPTSFERVLLDIARDFGVMRQLGTVFTTDSGEELLIPTITSHGTATWTAENAAYTPSDEVFGQASLSAYKATRIMLVSEELLADAAFDLEAYIRGEFGASVGVLENTAYVAGDGNGKPTGVAYSATAGVTGTAGQTLTFTTDNLIDLYHSVLSPYRRNGSFLASDGAIKSLRKLKDTTNQYLWQPGLTMGQPDSLLGKPIYADPDMAAPGVSTKSVLFGDFSYYRIRDVRGILIQRLNELYAANGQVGFRIFHRTDGKLLNTAAVKAYVHSAT